MNLLPVVPVTQVMEGKLGCLSGLCWWRTMVQGWVWNSVIALPTRRGPCFWFQRENFRWCNIHGMTIKLNQRVRKWFLWTCLSVPLVLPNRKSEGSAFLTPVAFSICISVWLAAVATWTSLPSARFSFLFFFPHWLYLMACITSLSRDWTCAPFSGSSES